MFTVFLPCRSGSERVPNKNTKAFAGVENGLLEIKLKQLLEVKLIDKIVVSTNDEKVKWITRTFQDDKIVIDHRPDRLALSSTKTDELISYVPNIIPQGNILWTHVTSPFLTADLYDCAIKHYSDQLESGFDSLMTVNKLKTFIWNEKGSVNYDRAVEKWPRTQTLPNLFEINSGIFINSRENYLKYNDRIGNKPFLFENEGFSSFDIDWPQDFSLGEMIYKNLYL